MQASAVHFGCGIWGLISVALLASEHRYQDVYSYGMDVDDEGTKCCGCEKRFEEIGDEGFMIL